MVLLDSEWREHFWWNFWLLVALDVFLFILVIIGLYRCYYASSMKHHYGPSMPQQQQQTTQQF